MLVALLTLAAVALIPATIGYYLWLARSVAPHLVSLPTRLAITILAVRVALPWIAVTAVVWLVWGERLGGRLHLIMPPNRIDGHKPAMIQRRGGDALPDIEGDGRGGFHALRCGRDHRDHHRRDHHHLADRAAVTGRALGADHHGCLPGEGSTGEEGTMSENPNPTKCSHCGTMNPPDQEVCRTCQAPLTLSASAPALAPTPEAEDEPRRYAAGGADDVPDVPEGGLLGGIGGAPIPVPTERLDPDPPEPPRE